MKLLYKAKSIIERDALRARLHGEAIASDSPERSMSRKVTNDTVDLSLGALSLFFDGFAIMVPEEDMERAKQVLTDFQKEMKESRDAAPPKHWPRAYSCAVYSIMIPVVFNVLALYHALRAWREGEKWPHSRFKMISAIAIWSLTTAVITLTALASL